MLTRRRGCEQALDPGSDLSAREAAGGQRRPAVEHVRGVGRPFPGHREGNLCPDVRRVRVHALE